MYLPRVVDGTIADILTYSGGVLIEGVRACGKTATGMHHSTSVVALDSGLPSISSALQIDPRMLLQGTTPRLIDEWQLAPQLWNIVRREIDARQTQGQFILTGSSIPAEDTMRHSGAHRISRVRMRPMTLFEQGKGSGEVSLRSLFAQQPLDTNLDTSSNVKDSLDAIVHGGWPGDINIGTAQAQRHLRDYVEDIINTDLGRLDGEPRRDPSKVRLFLMSLARNLATEVNYTTIATDMSAAEVTKPQTVSQYVNAFKRLMLIEEQPAWAPHLRSRARLRTSPKLHFVDPALACALLVASVDTLVADLNSAGFLFESQVVYHCRVFAEAQGGSVYHYRDSDTTEVDIVVTLPDGQWGAIEVKLGQRQLSIAQASLQRFVKKIDTEKVGKPKFLAVITSDGPIMTLPDGVITFPLQSFAP